MSIYKDNIRCAKLKRLGFFQYSALDSLIAHSYGDMVEKLNSLKSNLDGLKRIHTHAEYDPFDENSFDLYFREIEVENLRDAIDLFDQLRMLAAHKEVEKRILKIVTAAYDDAQGSRNELYKFNKLKEYLRSKGVDIEGCLYFKEINTLRLISNSIKHGDGFVSNELSAYTGWNARDSLPNMRTVYQSIEYKIIHFIEDFILQVEKSIGCYTAPSQGLIDAKNS